MFRISWKQRIGLFLVAATLSLVLIACGDHQNQTGSVPTSSIDETPFDEDVVITIGNLSDLTGVSAGAMKYINVALDDLVGYYNDNNLIPGVSLKVVTYDGQMDPAKDVPGYEWLMKKGADVLFTPIPATPVTLKPRVDQDRIVLFTMTSQKEGFLPPGYVFNLGIDPQYDGYTMMKWIAEYDWDWETQGPARVGGAAWSESYSDELMNGMKEYCVAHPEQFDWIGGHLTDFGFSWESEVEALKNCNYVYPGIVFINFVKQYRNAGCVEAKLIGTETQTAFFDLVDDSDLWDEIDGMLFLKFSRWWNEDGEIISLIKQILNDSHPDKAEEVISAGVGYLSLNQLYAMLEIIRNATEQVGPQNVDSQSIYASAQSFSLYTDGIQRLSFSDEKRDAVDAYAMYEARASEKDIFRIHNEWFPTVRNVTNN